MIELRSVRAKGLPHKGEPRPMLRGENVVIGAGVTVLVGPRAGGGPLVLDLLHGRVRPSAGTVTIEGKNAGDPSLSKEIAYVPLACELPSGLTVLESVRLSFSARAKGPRDATAALDRLGLAPLALRKTGTLTQGEHRAVLLAIALACSPRVLLMEEPCTWFDARALAKITEALRALASEGSAVVASTQSNLDAERLGGRILRVENGRIVEGAPHAEKNALKITSTRARELGVALATLASVVKIEVTDTHVIATGKDAHALARDVGRAIAVGEIDVIALEPCGAST